MKKEEQGMLSLQKVDHFFPYKLLLEIFATLFENREIKVSRKFVAAKIK